MAHVEGEIIINRPVEEVFDFVADERNEPLFNPSMVWARKTSDGPIGLGTQFQALMRVMGRPAEMTIEFTRYERPHRLASSTSLSTMDIDGALNFEPVRQGTRMRWSWELKPRNGLKLLTPIIALMGQRQERTIWTGLSRYLENRAVPAAQT